MNINNFARRVLRFAARELNSINSRYEQIDNERKQQQIDRSWLDNFQSADFFDYRLSGGPCIRLYKDSVLSRLIFTGFENQEIKFVKCFLRPGDTFFDIGANIGLFSLVASSALQDSGKIFAFEPSPKTFVRLGENLEINGISCATVLNIGLSDKIGRLSLSISENGYDAWNSFAGLEEDKFSKTHEVDVDTLDNIVESYKVESIDLIKLDVEGWEKYVLRGGEKTLKTFSPVVMVEFTESNTFSAGYHVQELYDVLREWGYQWYRYDGEKLIVETKKLHYPYDNLFAIKNFHSVMNRLAER